MSVFKRLGQVIKSNLNEVIDKMSDPAKEIELLIVEMEEGLKEAKSAVVDAKADEKKIEKKIVSIEEDSRRWEERAKQAVMAGDDQLAKEALGQKLDVDRSLDEQKSLLAQQRGYVEDSKAMLKKLQARLEDVKLRKETLKQKAKQAKDGSAIQGGGAFDRFDALEGKIEAMEELNEMTKSDAQQEFETEAKFERLDAKDPKIEDELAALKAKLDPPKDDA